MSGRLFSIGFGYVAKAFAARLADKGWRIAGTTRSEEKVGEMREAGVAPVIWDGEDLGFELLGGGSLDGATAILISTPPGDLGCPALLAAADAITAQKGAIGWIGYLSTNGVYGDHGGAWVDEESALKGNSERAQRRIEAEEAWRRFCARRDLPLTIFRLPGIYGPGRSALDSVRAGKAKRIYKKGQVFSRMHVDDIAAALEASMTAPRAHDLYNLCDDEPGPPQDIVAYACGLLGMEPPPLIPIEDASLSEMAQSFYADNKRVSNQRMKSAFGMKLAYPTYREGLNAIFNEGG